MTEDEQERYCSPPHTCIILRSKGQREFVKRQTDLYFITYSKAAREGSVSLRETAAGTSQSSKLSRIKGYESFTAPVFNKQALCSLNRTSVDVVQL